MGKRLTPEEKKHAVKQTLTAKEISRLENNPTARRVSPAELDELLEASRLKTPA